MQRLVLRAIVVMCAAGIVGFAAAPPVSGQAAKEPGVVVLKGAPMGGVKFDHAAHTKTHKAKCETCHHPSKPEKALKTPQQACSDCHTKTVAAPMKTNARGAFHDATAKKGTCIDCHVTDADKKAPVKCTDCHKKENA